MLSADLEGIDIYGLRAGDDWSFDLPIAVSWLPGDSARAHVRTSLDAPGTVVIFSTSPSAGQGTLTLTETGIRFTASATITGPLTLGSHVYDTEVVRSGLKDTIPGGVFQIAQKVTRGV